jgi:hypothetical protein
MMVIWLHIDYFFVDGFVSTFVSEVLQTQLSNITLTKGTVSKSDV